jgi:enterochelin esterase-like enzyme
MFQTKNTGITIEKYSINSQFLQRDVLIDCYYPGSFDLSQNISLLLINDGQDLRTMQFENILERLYTHQKILPVFCAGIHCSDDRKNEYGTANISDYKGRGAKAHLYTQFIMEELIPFIRKTYQVSSFKDKSFAGFSLGGLCALDIVWNHPAEFCRTGIFSGSLWWRDKDQEDADFDEDNDRIIHRKIRQGDFFPWLKFFFEVGTQDETADRNNNGIIDSIDDTLAVIKELTDKGYQPEYDVEYLELKDGKHTVETWARAFPYFLEWGWGLNEETDN